MAPRSVVALALAAAAIPQAVASSFSINLTPLPASQDATGLEVSNHVVTLSKSTAKSKSSLYARALAHTTANEDGAYFCHGHRGYGIEHLNNTFDVEFTGTVEFAGTPVTVIMDTGSSDTWLAQKGFQCVNKKGKKVPEAQCDFGPVFNGTFQHGEIKDANFAIGYGDGEFAYGNLGYEDVTVGGLTAEKQTVALVNQAYWNGDQVSSGLMGLAYPALTSEFPGHNISHDNPNHTILYDPIMFTLAKEKKMAPVFSLALARDDDKGLLALGGLPPVHASSKFYTTPILIVNLEDINVFSKQRSFYTVKVDGYHFGTKGHVKKSPIGNNSIAILDSGTTLAVLPTKLVNQIAAEFDPPAKYSSYFEGLAVACNATAPDFGVEIAGHVFNVSPKDLIFQGQVDPKTNECLVGIEGGGGDFPILGDTFLNNVIAAFDIGAGEVRLAEHVY